MMQNEQPKDLPDVEIEKREFPEDEIEKLSYATEDAELVDPVLEVFERCGCPLGDTMAEMLHETLEHRFDNDTYKNNRKGSGFTQATRVIGSLVSQGLAGTPQAYKEIFGISEEAQWSWVSDQVYKRVEVESNENQRPYAEIVEEVEREFEQKRHVDPESIDLERVKQELLSLPEHAQMLGKMILDVLQPVTEESYSQGEFLPRYEGEKKIGTCTTAEKYFLDAAYTAPHHRQEHVVESQRKLNVILSKEGNPVMLEKVGMGEAHSALTIREVVVGGVRIPPGALMYVDYPQERQARTIKAEDCNGFSLLRLTPLAVPPDVRKRTFGMIVGFQERNEMPNAAGAKIEHYHAIADKIVKEDKGIFERFFSRTKKRSSDS